MFQPCAIVPVYNHGQTVSGVCAELRASGLPVILVDDGSLPDCTATIRRLADERVFVVRHDSNQGKGAAVSTALHVAQKLGFTHALQVDADGQHELNDASRFVDAARTHPDEMICGLPQFDQDIPAVRFYGRYLSHGMVWLETLSFAIPDSMCGMRLYPLQTTLELLDAVSLGARMDFDIEVLVRLNWRAVGMRWLPTKVKYPVDGVSHYRLFRDNARIVFLHARLLVGMVLRLPWLLRRNLARLVGSPRLTQ